MSLNHTLYNYDFNLHSIYNFIIYKGIYLLYSTTDNITNLRTGAAILYIY